MSLLNRFRRRRLEQILVAFNRLLIGHIYDLHLKDYGAS
jgi:hypothetical protein